MIHTTQNWRIFREISRKILTEPNQTKFYGSKKKFLIWLKNKFEPKDLRKNTFWPFQYGKLIKSRFFLPLLLLLLLFLLPSPLSSHYLSRRGVVSSQNTTLKWSGQNLTRWEFEPNWKKKNKKKFYRKFRRLVNSCYFLITTRVEKFRFFFSGRSLACFISRPISPKPFVMSFLAKNKK